ncbi:hypothetical protein D3C76_1588470 [compost metagenome]
MTRPDGRIEVLPLCRVGCLVEFLSQPRHGRVVIIHRLDHVLEGVQAIMPLLGIVNGHRFVIELFTVDLDPAGIVAQ